MNVYPAIDILNGKAVRLRQGRADEVTVYGEPMKMAEQWAQAGTGWLHIVDLDGAFSGTRHNHSIVAEIVRAFPKLKVQLGGGIRTMKVLEEVLAIGVQRPILGTILVTDPVFAAQALGRYGDRVAIGIDSWDGIVKVSGWIESSRVGAVDLARQLADRGAQLVIHTDISRDAALEGPNIDAMQRMLEGTNLNVIASGGVSKIDDVRTLAAIGHPRLDGVIIGKALYEGLVNLEDALTIGGVK